MSESYGFEVAQKFGPDLGRTARRYVATNVAMDDDAGSLVMAPTRRSRADRADS